MSSNSGISVLPSQERGREVRRVAWTRERGAGCVPSLTTCTRVAVRYGPFDMIVDDGGHTPEMISVSVATLLPDSACLRPKGVYIVEDTHALVKWPEREMYQDIVGKAFVGMHHFWMGRSKRARVLNWTTHIAQMVLVDSMIVYHKIGPDHAPYTRLRRGTDKLRELTHEEAARRTRRHSSGP